MRENTPIGFWDDGNPRQSVSIPLALRMCHTHMIGGAGTGKSTLLEHMVMNDLLCGHGIAVLDPHGCLVQRVLCLIPSQEADRVIYFDPGDPEWTPLWNPLACTGHPDRSHVVEHVLSAFRRNNLDAGKGDRHEHLLRQALFAVLHLPGSCLLDAAHLLRKKPRQSMHIRAQLRTVLKNQYAVTFWEKEFDACSQDDLVPPMHSLARLLGSGGVGTMLSQGRSLVEFRQIMESGQALLVDLSRVCPGVRGVLGYLILSMLHLAALSRDREASPPRPFHVYCDDAHQVVSCLPEDLMAEGRKLGVSLVLSHQYRSQFVAREADVLSSVGSTIMFRVDTDDARHLMKDLRGEVSIADLVDQDVGRAIARIGGDVVRLRTSPPLLIQNDHCRDLIVQRSHERYYRPVR